MKTKNIVTIAIMSAIGVILSFLEFNVPIFPPFLKFDFSDFPSIIGGLVFAPWVGVLVALIKNGVHLLNTHTGGVGELANFLVSSSFVLAMGLVYRKNKTKKKALIGLILGIIAMIIVAVLANKFLLFPLYKLKLPIEMIATAIVPFNLIKGTYLAILTWITYKKISGLIKK